MKSQKQIVLARLKKEGVITNKWAWQHAIWRLSHVIWLLRGEGYKITTEIGTKKVGNNCHYRIIL